MPEPIFTLDAIGLKTGTGWLFQGLSLTLDARDRVALIGRNGAGKSTLLKIIDGSIESDQGRRACRRAEDRPAGTGSTDGRIRQSGSLCAGWRR